MQTALLRHLFSSWMLLLLLSSSVQAEQFPLREKFPDVATISTAELHQRYSEFTIIDTRSRFEYDTVHINKAARVPISSKNFIKLLSKEAPDKSTQIAFYCNGEACSKSYRAALMATKAGYTQVSTYDAGIFEWTKKNPTQATLLGNSPADPRELISREKLNQHMVDLDTFKQRATHPNTIVIDIRDAAQRINRDDSKNELPGMPPLERKNNLKLGMDLAKRKLNQRKFRNKQLLIFDATGKQVRWLQYSLEKNGYSNYAFLKGGIYSVTQVVHQ